MTKMLSSRYLVIKTLARGGFSKTYLAQDTHIPSQRICVVKQFKPLSANSSHRKALEKRFQKEAETLEKLSQNNPQIPELYAYFNIGNDFFLVQEFIEGKTLLEIIQTEKVSEDFVINLLNDLLPVLDFIHNQGIIHRDIKPANIILRNTDNKPVLIDFGAVRELMMVDDSQDSKKSTLVIGTPGYMPSEQVVGQAFYNIDGIAVIVNHNLNIDGLTVEQIAQIYSGKVINWQELGGQDLTIKPLTPPLGSGATGFLREQVLGDLDLADNVKQIKTPNDAIQQVAEETLDTSASIYLASAANLIGECSVKPVAIALSPNDNFVKPYQGELPSPDKCQQGDIIPNFSAFRNDEYPFVRRLFVIIRQDNTLQEKAGQTYTDLLLSDEGQKLIQESGFIAIRSF